jgi:hypothetical protein
MTTMIRKSRAIVAASILTAVIMSFPAATTSEAVQRDVRRSVSTTICPIDWRQSTWHVKQLIRCAASHHGVSQSTALAIAYRESRYRPSAYNHGGEAAGIFQHLLRYWPDRSETFGFEDWSVFNARANIMVTMRMVRLYGWDPWGG